jgi:hypothetical protein
MADQRTRRFYLLTYPRTASNLLVQILALDDQPTLLPDAKKEYFFVPALRWKLGPAKLGGKNLSDWTDEERKGLLESYQTCTRSLEDQVKTSATQGKDFFVKEHVPWLLDPVAESRWLFGEGNKAEAPWTVCTNGILEESHSPNNETVFSDEFLKTWSPTFLIRHPALVFPSNYRTGVDLQGADATRTEAYHKVEMTMHWSRTLFDWYAEHLSTSHPDSDPDVSWPIILDADDIMLEPEVVRRYSDILGLDQSKLKFSWQPASTEALDKMSKAEKRMRSTIAASAGIVKDKTSIGLDIAEEAAKWKIEFGEQEGQRIENWVRAAMPDYEYMRGKRLRPRKS